MEQKKISLKNSGNGGKYEKECAFCGKKFRTDSPGRLYCSDKCKRDKASFEQRNVEYECVCCGEKFIAPLSRNRLYCPKHITKRARDAFYKKQHEEREKAWIEHSKEDRYKKQASAVRILRPGISVMYEKRKAIVVDPLIPSLDFGGEIKKVDRRRIEFV